MNHYEQPIVCEICKKLLGYAPYWRTAYQCIECNKKQGPKMNPIAPEITTYIDAQIKLLEKSLISKIKRECKIEVEAQIDNLEDHTTNEITSQIADRFDKVQNKVIGKIVEALMNT